MPQSPGTRLGHYSVTALIGEGGMGQVLRPTRGGRRLRFGGSRVPLRQLIRVFTRSEASCGRALPIQRTRLGIWVPTPVRVAQEALEKLATIDLFGDGTQANHVIDAGTGDGRIPAVLASLDPTRVVYGIEADPGLFTRAVMNLQALATSGVIDPARVQLIEADYGDLTTYETRGIQLRRTGVVLNYPDGNERRLARFVSAHCGRGTTLCLLTHDRTLEVEELELRDRFDVNAGAGPAWQLSLYSRC